MNFWLALAEAYEEFRLTLFCNDVKEFEARADVLRCYRGMDLIVFGIEDEAASAWVRANFGRGVVFDCDVELFRGKGDRRSEVGRWRLGWATLSKYSESKRGGVVTCEVVVSSPQVGGLDGRYF